MTAQELIEVNRHRNPGKRFAVTPRGDAVAYWHSSGEWVPCAGLGIDGEWYAQHGGILANGEPIWFDWQEVA